MGGGTSLWATFAPAAVAGLRLFAHHVAPTNAKPAPSVAAKALRWGVLLLAMAFRGDAAPGRHATEAMERSGSDPDGRRADDASSGSQREGLPAEERVDAGR